MMPYLVNESEVMGDKYKATLEALDGLCQRVNGFNVQMVGGLIQQQQVGVLHANHGKHKATLLAITQFSNLGCLHFACTARLCPVSAKQQLPCQRKGGCLLDAACKTTCITVTEYQIRTSAILVICIGLFVKIPTYIECSANGHSASALLPVSYFLLCLTLD